MQPSSDLRTQRSIGWDDCSGEELIIALLMSVLLGFGGHGTAREIRAMIEDRDEEAMRRFGRSIHDAPHLPKPIATSVMRQALTGSPSTTDDLVDLAPRPARDAAEAGESDALHGRALGPRHLERGGPGESPPGAGPG